MWCIKGKCSLCAYVAIFSDSTLLAGLLRLLKILRHIKHAERHSPEAETPRTGHQVKLISEADYHLL